MYARPLDRPPKWHPKFLAATFAILGLFQCSLNHVKISYITCSDAQVIDEADRLLTQSFQDWLAQVLAATRVISSVSTTSAPGNEASPPKDNLPYPDSLSPAFFGQISSVPHNYTDFDDKKEPSCQKLLFSATLTRDPSKIAALNLREPKYFVIQTTSEGVSSQEDGVLDLVMEKFSMPATLTVSLSEIVS